MASDAHSSQLSNLQLIPAMLFQLTEWVYKLLAFTQLAAAQAGASEVVEVYTKCLDWYESVVALLRPTENDTPFVLFVQ